jgi:hypothetical protein
VAGIPVPFGGKWYKASCPSVRALAGEVDISRYDGWQAYLEQLRSAEPAIVNMAGFAQLKYRKK